jgi:hypothetical protein
MTTPGTRVKSAVNFAPHKKEPRGSASMVDEIRDEMRATILAEDGQWFVSPKAEQAAIRCNGR